MMPVPSYRCSQVGTCPGGTWVSCALCWLYSTVKGKRGRTEVQPKNLCCLQQIATRQSTIWIHSPFVLVTCNCTMADKNRILKELKDLACVCCPSLIDNGKAGVSGVIAELERKSQECSPKPSEMTCVIGKECLKDQMGLPMTVASSRFETCGVPAPHRRSLLGRHCPHRGLSLQPAKDEIHHQSLASKREQSNRCNLSRYPQERVEVRRP